MALIGVLALQGDFIEHVHALQRIGADTREVRLAQHLQGLAGLILPGGESTTIGKLAVAYGLVEPIREFGKHHAIWGTCAGAIFLSKDAKRHQPLLELMNITVERNAFGRQVDSFEVDLNIPALRKVDPSDRPYHAVFIRAPLIDSVSAGVEVLSRLPNGKIVAACEGHFLATVFHPELTQDDRFHKMFVEMSKSD